jgi:EAL domain-containing protein (putative c-di-GMP-specific phosphodiesterase class I)
VIRTALRQLSHWPDGLTPGTLNINLSVLELRETDLAVEVARLLAEHALDPGRITFEIVESMALLDPRAIATVAELRALGVRVALDDFGTGYSTLSLLQSCPVDELKLDRSFTWAAPGGRATIAAAVIQLSRTLGLRVVAEGVETAEQADTLIALGYGAAQGYHYARPMPAVDFARFRSRPAGSGPCAAPVGGPPAGFHAAPIGSP